MSISLFPRSKQGNVHVHYTTATDNMGTQYEVHRPTVCLLVEHLFKVDHKIMKKSVEGWW